MTQKALSYRPEIDVLRAWAVIIVVLYHLDIPSFSGGFIGVDVFFVISGYLITRNIRISLEKDTFSLSRFYAQRARRLMPSLLVTLIITLILGFYLMASSHFLALAKNAFGAVLSISNIFFWKQTSYFDDALKLNPMMHTWSLSLEEQFYLLYPLLLIWLTKKSKNRKSLTWSLSIASLVSLIFSIWATKHHSAFAFYMVPARLWEFSIGGLVWCLEDLRVHKDKTHSPNALQDSSIKSNLSIALHALSLVIILYSCARLDEHDQFPGLLALLPCLAASLFIYIPPINHFLTPLYLHKTWVKLGQMSYAIYLVHWPIITFYRHYYFDIKLSLISQIQIILLTLISAYALHVLVEQPLRKKIILWKEIRLIPVLITIVLCLASVSLYLWKTPQSIADAETQKILVNHGLNQNLALKDFKRSTYGGQGCKPPRCSTHSSPLITTLTPARSEPKSSKIDAFIIGDSYALAFFQGIKKHFPHLNIIFWERGACEFYSLSYVGNKNKAQKKCVQSKKDAFEELSKSPETPVVLGQHWHSNFDEQMLLWGSYPDFLKSKQGNDLSNLPSIISYHDVNEYARFVAQELRALKVKLGIKKLTILGGPPKFAPVFSPLDCMLSPLRPRSCEISPHNEFTLWHKHFQQALMSHVQDEFRLIDLYPALCNEHHCRNLNSDQHLIYSDYGHLSKWGAQELVQKLKPSFQEALTP